MSFLEQEGLYGEKKNKKTKHDLKCCTQSKAVTKLIFGSCLATHCVDETVLQTHRDKNTPTQDLKG